MTTEPSRSEERSSNPFISWDQEHNAELARLGLDALSPADQTLVWHQVRIRISDECITDEAGQRKAADEVIRQYREYQTHKAAAEALERQAEQGKAKEAEKRQGVLDDLLKNNAITQLQGQVKSLDERLRKLERYTEE